MDKNLLEVKIFNQYGQRKITAVNFVVCFCSDTGSLQICLCVPEQR